MNGIRIHFSSSVETMFIRDGVYMHFYIKFLVRYPIIFTLKVYFTTDFIHCKEEITIDCLKPISILLFIDW